MPAGRPSRTDPNELALATTEFWDCHYTLEEAARFLGCSRANVSRESRLGRIRSRKWDGYFGYNQADCRALKAYRARPLPPSRPPRP